MMTDDKGLLHGKYRDYFQKMSKSFLELLRELTNETKSSADTIAAVGGMVACVNALLPALLCIASELEKLNIDRTEPTE